MSVEPFFWPHIPMGSWDDVILVDYDEAGADTHLTNRVGKHLWCDGEMRRVGLKEDGLPEISNSDVLVACRSCQTSVVIPRGIRTYGDLCAFLFDLSGYPAPED